MIFLSTPSARRATNSFRFTAIPLTISIHALREEGDMLVSCLLPVGVVFLSTPSARRATFRCPASPSSTSISIHALREEGDARGPSRRGCRSISIHALREEGDLRPSVSSLSGLNFYPRPPRGGRPRASSTATSTCSYFYPRPPRGGRPWSARRRPSTSHFYPRPPRGGRPAWCLIGSRL